MQCNCPRCSERFSLEAAVEDECGRAFMALLARMLGMSREIILYMGLFRPRTQSLCWSRTLALAEDLEQLANQYGQGMVATALRETTDAMRAKMGAGWKPMKNHNYLMRVLESVAERGEPATAVPVNPDQQPVKHRSKTALALLALQEDD